MVTDRQSNAGAMQDILTANGGLILARLGVNPQRSCLEHCSGVIVIIVEGEKKDIEDLAGVLDNLYGITAKSVIIA